MTKQRKSKLHRAAKTSTDLSWHRSPVTRDLLGVGQIEIESVGSPRAVEIVEQHMQRIFELEAVLDFYAWGPSERGSLAPMRGQTYAKAIAKDGGRVARAALKDRLDSTWHGAPNRSAPASWGIASMSYAAVYPTKRGRSLKRRRQAQA